MHQYSEDRQISLIHQHKLSTKIFLKIVKILQHGFAGTALYCPRNRFQETVKENKANAD